MIQLQFSLFTRAASYTDHKLTLPV